MRRLLRWVVEFIDGLLDTIIPGRIARKFEARIEQRLVSMAGLATRRGHIFDVGTMMVALRDGQGMAALEICIAIGDKDPEIRVALTSAVFDYIVLKKIPASRYSAGDEEGKAASGQTEEAGEGGQEDPTEEGSGET